MIRDATHADILKCEQLAAEFYSRWNTRGQFSGQYFIEYWGKIFEAGIGRILLRESDGKPMEALGFVIHPSLAGKPAISTVFWYVADEPQGLASGALLDRFIEEADKLKATEIRIALLVDERLVRIASTLKQYGFTAYEMVYLKESSICR